MALVMTHLLYVKDNSVKAGARKRELFSFRSAWITNTLPNINSYMASVVTPEARVTVETFRLVHYSLLLVYVTHI